MTAPHEYQLLANCQLISALSQGTVSRQRDWNLEQHVVLRGGGGGIGLAGAEVGELGVVMGGGVGSVLVGVRSSLDDGLPSV